MRGHELKELGEGSSLELERKSDSPLVVLANGQPVALAAPVAAQDRLEIRVTRVLDEGERRQYSRYAEAIPFTKLDAGS